MDDEIPTRKTSSAASLIIELDTESGTEAAKYADRALIGEIEGNIESDHWLKKLQGSTFDYIIFADVLEHLHNPAGILARATGLLSANGSIIVSIPNIAPQLDPH